MFHCPRFAMENRNLNQAQYRSVRPENIVGYTQKWKNRITVYSEIVKIEELLNEGTKGKAQRSKSKSA